ncbi:hypothetical protein [Bacillus gaemokensis]|uniref:Permease n=1 Tax=Bacillus gaemokensis TaxID=574375 RepID=A0A073KES7_9BACI|nr:hypothetical protein [Bacillus gaemokensis]KEK24996.1 permease [Bacillus gaemokensis]KYG32615.1 permease [Bacillus gaemokensis]
MKPPFICHICKKRIARKQNLITAILYIRIYLFHTSCFSRLFFPSRFIPINTLFGVYFIWYTLATGIILIVTEQSIIWIVFLAPSLYRFISYYMIERHLER